MMNVKPSQNEHLKTTQETPEEKRTAGRPRNLDVDLEKVNRGCYMVLDPQTGEYINIRTAGREQFERLIKQFIALVNPAYPLLWRAILLQQIVGDTRFKYLEVDPTLTEEEADQLNDQEDHSITRVISVPDDGEYEIIVRKKENLPEDNTEDQPVDKPQQELIATAHMMSMYHIFNTVQPVEPTEIISEE